MPDIFAPAIPPQSGAEGDVRYALETVQFGDGYKAIIGQGMNEEEDSWPLIWRGTESEILPIRDFFTSHKGESFYWTPPGGVQGRYVVMGHRLLSEGVNYQLSAVLERAYRP